MSEESKRFEPKCPEPDTCYAEAIDRIHGPNHMHAGQWEAYCGSLSEEQLQFLRDKAAWEGMSVSAVAREWGAPVQQPQALAPKENT